MRFIALAKTTSTKLNRHVECNQPCLDLDFHRVAWSFSSLKLTLAMPLLHLSLLCCGIPLVFLILPVLLSWRNIEFCQVPILHSIRWSFSLSFRYFIWWLLSSVYIYWTIPVFLEWILYNHGGWLFEYVLGFGLQLFYWDIFVSLFIEEIDVQFSCFWGSYCDLGIRVTWDS